LTEIKLNVAFRRHSRQWHTNRYVYPVVSRRSRGLSIGVNLNPDKACNFDCIYCQVDRTTPPVVRRVDVGILETELVSMIELANDGTLFEEEPFSVVAPEHRVIRDIAFSGDGEPTTSPQFPDAVKIAAAARQRFALNDTKLVLITDATYLTRPRVREALQVLDRNNGEIWAKLDAGTDEYFQLVDRPNVTLQVVLDNILDAACDRPVVIQSMFLRVSSEGPSAAEIDAYCDRLNELRASGGQLHALQLYTVARPPAEALVSALPDAELDAIAERVRGRVPVPVEVFYGG
jgi:wyosine [tRNA(Phe)-imidazoG37] synthetase (radical SAM superfamily)